MSSAGGAGREDGASGGGGGASEFLSDEWLARLGGRLADLEPLESPNIALGVLVTGVPAGAGGTSLEVRYVIRAGGGRPASLDVGTTDGADVVMVESYGDAYALAGGEATAANLLERGAIKLRGDARRLTAAVDTLSALGEVFSTTGR